jgi:hypothetical protein
MSPEQAKAALMTNRSAYNLAMRDLIPVARAAVDALKDAGRPATASTLESKLFSVEALETDMEEMIKNDPLAFLVAMKESLVS